MSELAIETVNRLDSAEPNQKIQTRPLHYAAVTKADLTSATGALPYVSRRDPGSLPCIAIGTASSGLETIDQVIDKAFRFAEPMRKAT